MKNTPSRLTISAALASIALTGALSSQVSAAEAAAKPTIILVHGAFADSSSWDGVTAKLEKDGYTVIGVANPLRSVKSDASAVASVLHSVSGPVVLVGHSYGGSVISAAAPGAANVKALVYVAAFAPESGETAVGLSGKFPGSTLGPALAPPVALADGGKDLYIQQSKFHQQFAADLPEAQARLMATGQRPVTDAALNEASPAPAWKTIPSWFIYGKADKNIPAAAQDFMAKRAKARKTIVIDGASHVVMTSHPAEVAKLIEEAAGSK
jgi:pimeloyl-ACP methyl ester carboxylesterase